MIRKVLHFFGNHRWEYRHYNYDMDKIDRIIFTVGAYYQWRQCSICKRIEFGIMRKDKNVMYVSWEHFHNEDMYYTNEVPFLK